MCRQKEGHTRAIESVVVLLHVCKYAKRTVYALLFLQLEKKTREGEFTMLNVFNAVCKNRKRIFSPIKNKLIS